MGNLNLLHKSKSYRSEILPTDEGMMHSGAGSIMDEEGNVDLHAVMNMDDEPDTTSYPGENEDRERANDEVLHWHNGHRKPRIVRNNQREVYNNDDLWGN